MQEHTQAKTSTPGRHFKQITHPMRQLIETWHRQKVPAREMAARLGVHRSTIYRELERGRVVHRDSEWREFETYSADRAADVHDCNANAKGPPLKIGCNHALVDQFNELVLNHRLSLYAARQVLLRRGVAVNVCLRTLYNYVYRHAFPLRPDQLVQGPRNRRRRRGVRKRLAHNNLFGTSIEKRPAAVDERCEIGHQEMDTVVGPPGSKGVLLVLTERVTRFEHIILMPDKTAKSVCRALDRLERHYGASFKHLFKSITCDNGCEFSNARGIVKSCRTKGNRTSLFYAHPYRASERGSNENANRLIRRFIPKGVDFSSLHQRDVDHLAMWMNRYPRKILGGLPALNLASAYTFHSRRKT